MSAPACFCNAKSRQHCCVADCAAPHPGEDSCYPCNCWHGRERCLQTGQLKADRQRTQE